MSWFSMDKLTELKASAQNVAAAATAATSAVLTDEAAREDLIKKLTLNTDELISERKQIDEEETRKAEVKDKLSRLLPWETFDEEREILCEECKENILNMSAHSSTFTGPFALPGKSNEEVAAKETAEEGNDNGDEEEKEDTEGTAAAVAAAASDDDNGKDTEGESGAKPDLSDAAVKEAMMEAKKAKLDPLPPLLLDFDLDAHVGLIQRLFKEDANLVEMHADLGGAGERERNFWRNYFFHCALARYEAGLSVDEIWGDKPAEGPEPSAIVAAVAAVEEAAAEESTSASDVEETVLFEASSPARDATSGASTSLLDVQPSSGTPAVASAPSTGGNPAVAANSQGVDGGGDSSRGSSSFEMVGGSGGTGEAEDADDLDDLEAEIARELEGLDD